MLYLSPSILSADFAKLGEQVSQLEQAGAHWVHIDVMDGMFVPSISFGMPIMKSLRKVCNLFFDVHLMVQEPIRYINDFKEAGADLITVHVEACENVGETIKKIKEVGCKVGLSLNPTTAISEIEPWITEVDLILVMSVQPGFGGQSLIEYTLEKMKAIRVLIDKKNPKCYLEADGGIYLHNISDVLDSGVDVVVAGTSIFRGDIKENVSKFLEIMNQE